MREQPRMTRVAAVTVTLSGFAVSLFLSGCGHSASAKAPAVSDPATNSSQSAPAVELSPSQLNSIKIEPVGSYAFPVEEEAVGNIDYDEDLSVQVFPAYQGTT